MKRDVTMYTIADKLNVSVTAVSRAFNPNARIKKEKRELILKTAKRLGYVPNASASRLSQRTIRIGVVVYSHMRVYDDELLTGIQNAYKELHSFKVVCDVVQFNVNQNDVRQALETLDDFGTKKYDGILVVGIPRELLAPKIDWLDEQGCKVVLFDTDIPDSKRLFVAMNNYPVATGMVVDLLCQPSQQKRHTAVFTAIGQNKVVLNFRQQAQQAGIQIATECELSLKESPEDIRENLERVRRVFEKDPLIDSVYITSANCLSVCQYLSNSPLKNRITVIASDIFDEMRQYFHNGVIYASIYQNPVKQGYDAMKQLYHHLADKENVSPQLLAHPQVILRSNMILFLKEG